MTRSRSASTRAAADRERQRQLRGEIRVGEPAYAVGAEQSSHARNSDRHCRRSSERPTPPAREAASRPSEVDALADDQRLEYCGALRAFFRPYFLRSLARGSRVRKPAFFSGRPVVRVDLDQRAGDGQPQRAGLAGGAAAAEVGEDVEALGLAPR